MFFFVACLAVVLFALGYWWVRSPVARQLRRRRGSDDSTAKRLSGHRLDRVAYRNPTWNDDGRGGSRQSTRVARQLGVRGKRR